MRKGLTVDIYPDAAKDELEVSLPRRRAGAQTINKQWTCFDNLSLGGLVFVKTPGCPENKSEITAMVDVYVVVIQIDYTAVWRYLIIVIPPSLRNSLEAEARRTSCCRTGPATPAGTTSSSSPTRLAAGSSEGGHRDADSVIRFWTSEGLTQAES